MNRRAVRIFFLVLTVWGLIFSGLLLHSQQKGEKEKKKKPVVITNKTLYEYLNDNNIGTFKWEENKDDPSEKSEDDLGLVLEYYRKGHRVSLDQFMANGRNGMIVKLRDGRKVAQESYKDDRKHGTWIKWYDTGVKKNEVNYENDRKNGKMIDWNPYGKKTDERDLKDGKLHGFWMTWYSNGYLKSRTGYLEGKMNGIQMSYYDNGERKSEFRYKNSLKHGKSVEWDKRGRIIQEQIWHEGKLVTQTVPD